LNPHDRRIVHLTLKDDPELETRSRGEGLLKRVVIVPKHKE
jgi:spoIIIJ-associated protein